MGNHVEERESYASFSRLVNEYITLQEVALSLILQEFRKILNVKFNEENM